MIKIYRIRVKIEMGYSKEEEKYYYLIFRLV